MTRDFYNIFNNIEDVGDGGGHAVRLQIARNFVLRTL